jgi:high affinity Mn2+ porin
MHGSFSSPYEGPRSLPPHLERRVSLTTTAFLAASLGRHVELVFNPEVAGGEGFGGVSGIAGFPNGEIPRVAAATPKPYVARGFVRLTWGIGSDRNRAESAPNVIGGEQPARRLMWVTGRFALSDYFDNNRYSHDPRAQFMNWALMANGAWDYPADVRGYTVATMSELTMRRWSARAAVALEPSTANGPTLDTRVAKNRGTVAEAEERHTLFGHAGAIRLLGYWNREHALTFRDGIRRHGTRKYGSGLNVEQEITADAGVFGRYGWSDGKTESWAFTQIDRSLSGGTQIQGRWWRRRRDRIGVAGVRNFLSGDQRRYLAGGGVGFIVGDGRLNYGPESIIETYYAWSPVSDWTLTADYQHVTNPAYNHDRGPVAVWSLRVHWER